MGAAVKDRTDDGYVSTAAAATPAPSRLATASAAVIRAARRLSHGRRRDGVPRATTSALERALDEAVDEYEGCQ